MFIKCYEKDKLTDEFYNYLNNIEEIKHWYPVSNTRMADVTDFLPYNSGTLYNLITCLNSIIVDELSKKTGVPSEYYLYHEHSTENYESVNVQPIGLFDAQIIKIFTNRHFKESTNFIYNKDNTTEYPEIENSLKQNSSQVFKIFRAKDDQLLVFCKNIDFSQFCKLIAINLSFIFDKNNFPDTVSKIQNCFTQLAYNNFNNFKTELEKINLKDYYNNYLTNNLIKVFNSSINEKLRSLKNNITSVNTRINSLIEDILYLEEQNKNHIRDYNSIKNEQTPDYSEIIDYIFNHKYIQEVTPYDNKHILLHIQSPIIYYDIDCVERLCSRLDKNSPQYTIFKEVFLEQKYELWTQCVFKFNTATLNPYPIEHHTGDRSSVYYHPHISEFLCLGTHINEIKKWAENNDYIGAIEQIIAASLNLNFTDGFVIDHFKGTLDEFPEIKTFKNKEDGKMYSVEDILNSN